MHSSPKSQTTRFTCLFIAVAWAACPLACKADDTATAAASASTNATVAATPAEAASTPAPVTAPEVTNAPTAATALATTNPPVAATEPTTTNLSATATAPVSTNTPAITNLPAAAIMPATATAPASTPPTPATQVTAMPWATALQSYQPFTLGAEAGTTGVGGGVGWRFADHFGLVGGMDYLKFSLNRTYSDVPYSGNVQLQSEYAGLNYYPSRTSSFHISLGAYFNQNQFTGSAVSATDGSIVVNGYPIKAGDSVSLEYKQQPVNPYVSIGGNIYFDRGHHLSLGGELGAFYLGNPRVSATSSDPAAQPYLAGYEQQVENDIKKVPVWPILKLSLNYSF